MDTLSIGIISGQKLVRKALYCLLSTLSLRWQLSLVVEADTVGDAVREIVAFKPHILLVDCDMSSEGLHCVRSVSTLSPSTKSLLLAGEADEMFAISALRSGAWGIVVKQAEPDLLRQAIEKIVNGEVWFSHRTIGNALHACINNESPTGSPLDQLTPRENEVLMLLSRGLCNKEIASQLFLAESTIKAYVKVIFRKLGVNSRLKAALSYADIVGTADRLTASPPTAIPLRSEQAVSRCKSRQERSRKVA